MNKKITEESITGFKLWLKQEDRSDGTIKKYVRDIIKLSNWLNGEPITKNLLTSWKEHLIEVEYSPATINSMIAAVNTYCRYAEINCRIKFLRIQKKMFCENSKELSKAEYERLIP